MSKLTLVIDDTTQTLTTLEAAVATYLERTLHRYYHELQVGSPERDDAARIIKNCDRLLAQIRNPATKNRPHKVNGQYESD